MLRAGVKLCASDAGVRVLPYYVYYMDEIYLLKDKSSHGGGGALLRRPL
jgi:hypothetical protein